MQIADALQFQGERNDAFYKKDKELVRSENYVDEYDWNNLNC
jgi:hypothetical protein